MNTMYTKALQIAKQKIRGGEAAPFFKKHYLDAAFSKNIFLWDSAFMASWAKYHTKELPIEQALNNFYDMQEPDGYICREYNEFGEPFWEKDHPVAINPPLLAFAELELYSQTRSKSRLQLVYPNLKKNFEYLVKTYQTEDKLFFSDGFSSGMDNIVRHPPNWVDDGKGIRCKPERIPKDHPCMSYYQTIYAGWNIQGRSVDFTCQMALFASNLATIGQILDFPKEEIEQFQRKHAEIKEAVNALCWNEEHGFYFDLGYGKHIVRYHIGHYWALIAEVVPKERLQRFIAPLKDPKKFKRTVMVPSLAADEPDYKAHGDYWNGGTWAPTTYMVIRGLQTVGERELAKEIAFNFYEAVHEVFERTGTFWENYAPEERKPGVPAAPDFCGWTAIAPIALYHEFIKPDLDQRGN
jgi:hypothetical protein